MATSPPNPNQPLLDDPTDPGRMGVISEVIVKASGLHDGTPTGGALWEKAKDLTRGDSWSLSGYGTTTTFENWEVAELNKLATAFELHLGRRYGRQMYICCSCSAAHEK